MKATHHTHQAQMSSNEIFETAPFICDEVVLDQHRDIFGNLVFRTGELFYNVVFKDGDNEWVRHDFCSPELIEKWDNKKN